VKILLTGFEPFGKVIENPSQRVVEHFAAKGLASEQKAELITAVLPVDYVAASAILRDLLETHKPDAVLMLGVAQMRDSINLERIALNINDAKIADNAGNQKSGQAIVEDAPVAYRSTLPLEAMYEAIQNAGIAVTYSNHAGAYLCNHVFYYARHWLENAGLGHIPCGFIHLPDMGEEAPKMPLAKMIRAVRLAMGAFKKETVADVLERLRQRLPEKPDWIAVTTTDGELIEGTQLTPRQHYGEENRLGPIVAAFSSLTDRVHEELLSGTSSCTYSVGNSGILLVWSLESDFIFTLKFDQEKSVSQISKHESVLENEIKSLEELLRKIKAKR
jgi:pyroglutamyl-peptidase